jgi:clan AA aspartic protease
VIAGTADARRRAVVGLVVVGRNGREQAVDAIVDTGFTGALTLPPSLVRLLELPFRGPVRGLLADGSERLLDVYRAVVLWNGDRRDVLVTGVDADPLVGMSMLVGHELCIRIVTGGEVRISPIEPAAP